MAKIFETSADISELAHKKFEETGLQQMGVTLKVMSLTKAKDVLKVSRANATTEFLTKTNEDYKFIWPIPTAETDANPKIKQNPGYTN